MTVLVTYASKHGATAQIAAAIADALTVGGVRADLRHASDVRDVTSYDAVVVGSAIYYGHWLAPAHGLVAALGAQLRARPVWAFSSGRVAGKPVIDIDSAHVAWILQNSGAREHVSFPGRLAADDLNWRERTAARAVEAQAGDYRDWDEIAAWGMGIAAAVAAGTGGPISGPMALAGPLPPDDAERMNTEELHLVIAAASLAPSIHNTQPWRFSVTADGALDVFADRERQLRVIDADARQLLVSCGGAIEFARLAVRGLGRTCALELLPDRANSDLLARLTPGAAAPPTPAESALVDAMSLRHTDRGPYDDTRVPAQVLDEARVGVETYGLWLRQIDLPVDRVVVNGALSDAERRQASDPAYAAEMRRWTNRPAREDGFAEPAPQWPVDRVSDVPLRDFSGNDTHRHAAAGDPPRVERDALVLLGSIADDAATHVATGRALAWLLLRLTAAGLAAQPLGQAFDDLEGRVRLGRDLRLIGYPQFLLRVGYGHASEQTARRGLNDVLAPHA
jgi:menaquinone-dependent protoporphyrinogen IX oxidase